MCPTRELAMQVTDHLKAVAKYTGLHVRPFFVFILFRVSWRLTARFGALCVFAV